MYAKDVEKLVLLLVLGSEFPSPKADGPIALSRKAHRPTANPGVGTPRLTSGGQRNTHHPIGRKRCRKGTCSRRHERKFRVAEGRNGRTYLVRATADPCSLIGQPGSVQTLLTGHGSDENEGTTRRETFADREATRLGHNDVGLCHPLRHVALEAENGRVQSHASRVSFDARRKARILAAHDGERDVGHAGKRADHAHDGAHTKAAAGHQDAKGCALRSRPPGDHLTKGRSHGNPGGEHELRRDAMGDEVIASTSSGRAIRVRAGLGPHRVRRVIGDDFDQRGPERAAPSRRPEDPEGKEMGSHDGERIAGGNLGEERFAEPVINTPSELPIADGPAMIRGEIRASVETRPMSRRAKVGVHIEPREPWGGKGQRVHHVGSNAPRLRALGNRLGGGLVPSPSGAVEDE